MKPRRTIAIIGSSGMLGQDLQSACLESDCCELITYADRAALDITDRQQVQAELMRVRPNVIINAAAYTDVDGAESEQEMAMRVNHHAVAALADVARDLQSLLVHFSTDYVFNGRAKRPYRIDDAVDPVNYYGRTKLAGEEAIRASGCHHLIVRTSWLFAPHGRNFVKTVLRLAASGDRMRIVRDQRGRPTSTADLASMTCRLVRQGAMGTYHFANAGDCSWFEFADAIVAGAGAHCEVEPIETSEFPRPAARPRYSVLDLSSAQSSTGHPRHWRDALSDCLEVILHDGVEADSDQIALLSC